MSNNNDVSHPNIIQINHHQISRNDIDDDRFRSSSTIDFLLCSGLYQTINLNKIQNRNNIKIMLQVQ